MINKLTNEYFKTSLNGLEAYLRLDCIDKVKKVDAIIFDCDGVLVDVRGSYKKTVMRTIEFFLKRILGIELPSTNVFEKAVFHLKKSGGFNNDHDVVYSILLYIFVKASRIFQEKFIDLVQTDVFKKATHYERFDYIATESKDVKPLNSIKDWPRWTTDLNEFTKKADASGISSIERMLIKSSDMEKAVGEPVKQFLGYPEGDQKSILVTVFDEIFFGSKLFKVKNGSNPRFFKRKGLIEEEKVTITPHTLSEIAKTIGGNNFGIVSGRDSLSAKYTLGKILNTFRREALIFLLDHPQRVSKEKVKKPHPYPLMTSAAGLKPFKYAMYVGDATEDILMVEKANEMDNRYLSVGVYSLSDFQEDVLPHLIELKTDVILPSVNDLPVLLSSIMSDKL